MGSPTTYVLGLGNVLMGDDGFGPAVIQAFSREYVVGPDVAVVDLGTPGLDLTPWLAGVRHVILVDTIASGQPAGTVCVYAKADLLRHRPAARIGPHDPAVKEALVALDLAGLAPRLVTLVGAVPRSVAMGLDLSDPLTQAVPVAVQAIVAALEKSGASVARRADPTPVEPWWQTQARSA